VEKSPSSEADGLLIFEEICCLVGVMECQVSLQCSQALAAGPYSEGDEARINRHTLFF